MKRVVVVAAVLVVLLSGCWTKGATSGPAVGGPPPDGHRYAWSSQLFRFYGCPTIPGYDRCADSIGIGLGEPLGVDPEPKMSGGLPAYQIDWKDPSRLTYPPAGSPAIVLRVEFANTVDIPNGYTCPDPGQPAAQVPAAIYAASNITAINCLVTSDERMLIDIGMKKKVGYRVFRCFEPVFETGYFRLDLEPPPDGKHTVWDCDNEV